MTDEIFTQRFEFPDGIVHERCEKPSDTLTPHKHWAMDLPGDLGRGTLDTYLAKSGVYSRTVAMRSGQVAWFRVSRKAQS